MKKLESLKTVLMTIMLLFAFSIAGIAQSEGIIYQTDFEAESGFTAGNVYNNVTVAFFGEETHQWGTYYGTPSTTASIEDAQSLQLRWYASASDNLGYTFTNFDLANVTQVMFNASSTNNLNVVVSYSTDGGTTYTGESLFTLTNTSTQYTYSVSSTGQYANVRIKFAVSLPETTPSGTSRLFVDNVVVYGMQGVAPTVVSAPTFSENAGFFYNPFQVTISSTTEDAVIYYTLDGTTPDSTAGTLYTGAITIDETSTLKAIAYAEDLDASNVTTATYNFPVEVADIAAFLAANTATNTTVYKITGDVTYIARIGRYIFLQDESASLVVYDSYTPVVTNEYENGDVITGICGTYSLYSGLSELVPTVNFPVSVEQNTPVAPTLVTLAEIEADHNAFMGKYIKVKDVVFAGGTYTTSSATNINITQGDVTIVCRNIFKTLDMTIPADYHGNVTGFGMIYNTSFQLAPMSNEDIIPAAANLPLVQDFETADPSWVIVNGEQTNKWFVGQAQGFDNNKLFISSSNGITNKYNINSTSAVHAYRSINIPAGGGILTFDARVAGENNFDYLQISLLDEGTILTEGVVPSTYIARISMANDWTTYNYTISPSMAGEKMLVFTWKNDISGGEQFPAAVDNINIVPSTCVVPSNLNIAVTETSATITWDAPADQNSWLLQYKLNNHSSWNTVNVTGTPSVTLSNLQGNSLYDIRVKATCGSQESIFLTSTFAVDCQDLTILPTDIAIGTGTSYSYYAPFNNFYCYSWNQTIYTANEIGIGGNIYSIAYNSNSTASITCSSVNIYLAHTTMATNTSTTSWIPESDLTLVYSGSDIVLGGREGWQTFTLNTPFYYNGTDNLAIIVSKSTSGYSSTLRYYYTSASNSCLYRQNDRSEAYASHPGSSTGTRTSYKPNVTFNMDAIICGDQILCPAPTNLTVSNIEAYSAELAWTSNGTETEWIVEYMAEGAEEWTSIVTTVNPFVLTGIDRLTDYQVRVKANCGTNNLSNYSNTANFTTLATCFVPTAISHYNSSTTTVLNWTAGGDEEHWIVEFKQVAQEENDYIAIPVNFNPSTAFGGLVANTAYVGRIKSVCDEETNDVSEWTYYYFTSGCSPYDLNFKEEFASSYLPQCWTNNGFTFTGGTARSATSGNYIITPAINIPDEGGVTLTYDIASLSGNSENYEVLLSFRGTSSDDFLSLYNGSIASTDAETRSIEIPEFYNGQTLYVIFAHTSANSSTSLVLDNVILSQCAATPNNVVLTANVQNTVDIAWDAAPVAASWIVEYSTDQTEWMIATTTTNSYTIANTLPYTTYYVRVKSICENGIESTYSVISSVSTPCGYVNIPFREDFGTYGTGSSSYPSCWSKLNNYGSYPYLSPTSYSPPASLYFYGTTQYYSYAITPQIDPTVSINTLRLKFMARKSSTSASYGRFDVGVMTDPTDVNSFTVVHSYYGTDFAAASTWYPFELYMNTYTGEGQYIAIRVPNEGYSYLYVDNFELDFIPTCPEPSNFAVNSITDGTVNLSWTAGAAETSWNVEYGPAGYTQGTGTVLAATTTSASISGLNEITAYDFYVQANCGDNDFSIWIGPISATTPCNGGSVVSIGEGTATNSNLPFYGLYGYTYSQQIYDASEIGSTGIISDISFYCSSRPSSNAGAIKIWMANTSKSTFGNNTDYINPSDLTLVYEMPYELWNVEVGWNTITLDEPFIYDGTSNLAIAFYEGYAGYSSSSFMVHSTSANKSISHYSDSQGSVSFTNPASASGSKYFQMFRNNIKFTKCPAAAITCYQPTVQVSNISTTTADLAITSNGEETAWNIEYGPAGFIHGTGIVIPTTTLNNTLTDLNANTTYDVYVQANCGDGDVSTWASSSFTTELCNAADQCQYTFSLTDSYGDGWNGNKLAIYVDGALYTQYEIASGSSAAYTLSVCPSQTVQILWVLGSDANETSFTISGPNGYSVICADGSVYSNNDLVGSFVGCNEVITCSAPTDLTNTFVLNNTAGITWTPGGEETAWTIEYKNALSSTWITLPATSTSYTFTGLAFSTTYNVRVKAICGADDESFYSFVVNFTTPLAKDIELVSVMPIYDACDFTGKTIQINVANVGALSEIDAFTATYVLNGDTVTEIVTPETPIALNEEYSYTFNTLPIINQTENTLKVWVNTSEDINVANNSVEVENIYLVTPIEVPYSENFSTVELNKNGWMINDANNDSISWTISSSKLAYSYNDLQAANDWVFTPCMNIPSGKYQISYTYNANSPLTESFEVYAGFTPTPSGMIMPLTSHTFTQSDNNVVATHNVEIPANFGGTYYIGIKATSEAGNLGFTIDNLSITPIVDLTVTYGENGIINPNGNVEVLYNDFQPFSIIPDEGYHILDIIVNGEVIREEDMQNARFELFNYGPVTEPATIHVDFQISQYIIEGTISNFNNIDYNGDGTVAGEIIPTLDTVLFGDSYTVMVAVQPHFHLQDLIVNNTSVLQNVTADPANPNIYYYTFDRVLEDKDVHAVVRIDTVAVIYDVLAGEGTIDGEAVTAPTTKYTWVNYGSDLLSQFVPADGYHVESVAVSMNNQMINMGTISQFQFNNIIETQYVDVAFAPSTYTVTTEAFGNGTITDGVTFTYDNNTFNNNFECVVTPNEGSHITSILVNGVPREGFNPDGETFTLENVHQNYLIQAFFAINTYSITANAGNNGAITPNGVTTVDWHTTHVYTATAEEGFYISSVVLDGVTTNYTQSNNMTTWSHTFANVETDHTIIVSFASYQYTITATSGDNGTVTPAGTTTLNYNGAQVYSITPAAGYHILNVQVDNVDMGAISTYTFANVTENHTISATFSMNQYTILAGANNGGSITPNGLSTYNQGATQIYNITANAGYTLTALTVDGVVIPNANSYTFANIDDNHTIFAEFTINNFNVTVTQPANGFITPSSMTVANGATPTFTVIPNAGYHVTGFVVNGTNVAVTPNVDGTATYTFAPISANQTITANLAINTFTITASAGANGTISPNGASTVNYGANRSYTITPNNGFQIADVVIDGISLGAVNAYTFANVIANHTIAATFEYIPCEVPFNLYVINVTENSAILNWNETDAPSYTIRYKAIDGIDYTEIPGITSTNYTVSGLTDNTTYIWNVKAACQVTNQSVWSVQNSFTTLPHEEIGIEDANLANIQVYSNLNNVYIVNEQQLSIKQVEIFDIYGKIIYRGNAVNNPEVINLNVAEGNYIVRINTNDGIGVYKVFINR